MTYESRLAVDLSEWTYDVVIAAGQDERGVFTQKIPDHDILREYAVGEKRLYVMVGPDKVYVPKEFFQKLLWEISTCQELCRSIDGQHRLTS